MMTGAICQVAQMRGIRNAVVCDLRVEAALRAYELNGVDRDRVCVAERAAEANDAVRAGRPVVVQDALLVPELEVDCVVEGTGVPEVGAEVAYRCVQAGRHVLMLNVESDVVVGPILHQLARRAGVVYSVTSGDEPGLITELVDRWAGSASRSSRSARRRPAWPSWTGTRRPTWCATTRTHSASTRTSW